MGDSLPPGLPTRLMSQALRKLDRHDQTYQLPGDFHQQIA